MTFKPFSPEKYLFIMTLAGSIEQFKKVTYLSQIHLRGKSTALCPTPRIVPLSG